MILTSYGFDEGGGEWGRGLGGDEDAWAAGDNADATLLRGGRVLELSACRPDALPLVSPTCHATRIDHGRKAGSAPRRVIVDVVRRAALGLRVGAPERRVADRRLDCWGGAVWLDVERLGSACVEHHRASWRAPWIEYRHVALAQGRGAHALIQELLAAVAHMVRTAVAGVATHRAAIRKPVAGLPCEGCGDGVNSDRDER